MVHAWNSLNSDRVCMSTRVQVSPRILNSTWNGQNSNQAMLLLGLKWDFTVALVDISLMANTKEKSLCDYLLSTPPLW